MTRAVRKMLSISSSVGTRPNSDWRATAIFALNRFFFLSCAAIALLLFHNSCVLSSSETLIRERVSEHIVWGNPSSKSWEIIFGEASERRVSKRDLFGTVQLTFLKTVPHLSPLRLDRFFLHSEPKRRDQLLGCLPSQRAYETDPRHP